MNINKKIATEILCRYGFMLLVIIIHAHTDAVFALDKKQMTEPTHQYVILTNVSEKDSFYSVVRKLQVIRKGRIIRITPNNLESIIPELRSLQVRFVAVVVKPETIDEEFHTMVLKTLASLDDDPFVDVSFGYITGKTTEVALNYLENIESKERDYSQTDVKRFVLITGNEYGTRSGMYSFISAYCSNTDWKCEEYRTGEIESRNIVLALLGADLIYIYSHGNPMGISGLSSSDIKDTSLFPSVMIADSCYLGAINKMLFFSKSENKWIAAYLNPEYDSFVLNALANGSLGIVAHMRMQGLNEYFLMPVWYELQAKASTLGTAMMNAYNMHAASEMIRNPDFEWNIPVFISDWEIHNPYDEASNSISSYILYGDPALQPFHSEGKQVMDFRVDGEDNNYNVEIELKEDIGFHTYIGVQEATGGLGYIFGSIKKRIHVPVQIDISGGRKNLLSISDVRLSSSKPKLSSLEWMVDQTADGIVVHFFINVDEELNPKAGEFLYKQKIIEAGYRASIEFNVVNCTSPDTSLSYVENIMQCSKEKQNNE